MNMKNPKLDSEYFLVTPELQMELLSKMVYVTRTFLNMESP